MRERRGREGKGYNRVKIEIQGGEEAGKGERERERWGGVCVEGELG